VGSKLTSEVWLLDAAAPLGEPRVVAARRHGVEYDVEPAGDRLLIVHNANHPDFELAQAPLGATSHSQWSPLGDTVAGERLLGVEAFVSHAVLSLRRDGLTALRVLPRDQSASGFGPADDLVFDEPLYSVATGNNPEYETSAVQVVFESMVTPKTISDYDLVTGEYTLLKAQPVLGGYDPEDYEQRREWATTPDGTLVPISLVHRRDVTADGTAPGLLYGYGAYEICTDPYFSVARLSLLDRGFVYAIAHVRGGGEMGRQWYDSGKMEHKTNTFTDFVACADHLVSSGWVAPDRLVAEGGSAGGLLIGAVANLAPGRFRAIHAAVPFVDALTTILDPSLPLTVPEWEEWGDPLHDEGVYRYMKSYTPYENVAAVDYPAILATTSLNDTRVCFVEPAKWVARLRETVTSDPVTRPILFKIEMVAGHGGKSGRYDAWRQYAWELAFLMDQVGVS
jgi:oligopeptidase B